MSLFQKGVIWYLASLIVLGFLLGIVAWSHPAAASDRIVPSCHDEADQSSGAIKHFCEVAPRAAPAPLAAQPRREPIQPPPPRPGRPYYPPPQGAVPGPSVGVGPGIQFSGAVFQLGPVTIQIPPIFIAPPAPVYVQPPIPAPQAGPFSNPVGYVAARFVFCDGSGCYIRVPADGANVRVSPGGEISGAFVPGTPVIVLGQVSVWLAVTVPCHIVRTGLFSDTASGVPLLACSN